MVWPTKDVGDISDMLQMKTSSWLSQCMTTMAGLFITIAANVQDVASEMRHIHIGSTSDEEEEEDEEEEKEAMEKEPHLIQMRLALADISSDPAELCAFNLPRMINLTAQGIAEAAKGSQNQDKIEEEGEKDDDDDDDEELAMLCAWFKTKYCKQR